MSITENNLSGQYAAVGITLSNFSGKILDRSPACRTLLIYQVQGLNIYVGVHVSKTYEITEMNQLRIICSQFPHRNFSGFCGTVGHKSTN